MPDIFTVSYILLWLVVILISYGVIVVLKSAITARSTLYEQQEGLPEGVGFPLNNRIPMDGKALDVTGHGKLGTLIFLTSLQCLACKKLYSIINDVQKKMPAYQYLFMMSGPLEEVNAAIQEYGLEVPVIHVENFKDLQTPFVPFGYYVSPDGLIQAKGIINNEGHLQALVTHGEERTSA
ncbi:hypothetical protein J41TS12_01260 [Paenibacillus antibioticophila]|uniref:Thioredoxin domain-containing protein n=1 Tax=Paenibacillus antibioticophila TaxID=1274374 RepID=A0A919XQW1_9BACL|nr:hypothetical protein [Paenibacillus antibioticophila]GIO35265.1 hypothetical protein J41TS12_01260 [Paenibacillus antibioticophila]